MTYSDVQDWINERSGQMAANTASNLLAFAKRVSVVAVRDGKNQGSKADDPAAQASDERAVGAYRAIWGQGRRDDLPAAEWLWSQNCFGAVFAKAVKEAGLPPTTTPHKLHHHRASVLRSQGKSPTSRAVGAFGNTGNSSTPTATQCQARWTRLRQAIEETWFADTDAVGKCIRRVHSGPCTSRPESATQDCGRPSPSWTRC